MSKPQRNKGSDTQGTPSYVLVSIIFSILIFAIEGFKSSLGLGEGPSGIVNMAFVALGLALAFFWKRLQESRLRFFAASIFMLSLWSYLLLVVAGPFLKLGSLPHAALAEQYGFAAVLLAGLVLLLAVFYDAKRMPSLLAACGLGLITSLGSVWGLLPLGGGSKKAHHAPAHQAAADEHEIEPEAHASESHEDEGEAEGKVGDEDGEEIHASQFKSSHKSPPQLAHLAPESKPQRMAARLKERAKTEAKIAAESKAEAAAEPKAGTKGHKVHWTYEGDRGPDAWGHLSAEFRLCMEGSEQSPIDIPDNWPLYRQLEVHYRPSSFSVVDNGHTIQIDVEAGNVMSVKGKNYELKQIHFHSPSEHFFNGRSSILEAHFVHASPRGELAVLSSMIEPGILHKEYHKIWAHLPKREGETVKPRGKLFDPRALLPADLSVYQYPGSLTTPPCSEKVSWNVLREAVQLSQDQINRFRARYRLNARPIQPLYER